MSTDEIEKVTYDAKEERNSFLSGVGKHENELISILDLSAVAMEK